MSKKTIYEYDGYLFEDYDLLEEYVANLTGGEYNNADPYDTPAFYEAMEEVERKEVDWRLSGSSGELVNAITPILSTIQVIAHTTMDKQYLNNLIKELQIAVNRIDTNGFYGK